MEFKYNREDFHHNKGEFEDYEIVGYEALKLKRGLGKLERESGLLNELSKELFDNNCDLLSIGTTHGGFVPIMSHNSFNSVYIIDISEEHLKNTKKNSENIENVHLNINLAKKNFIVRVEAGRKINFANYSGNVIVAHEFLPDSLILKDSDIHVYIPVNLRNKFNEGFINYFEGNEFNFDNLLEYTMIIKNGGDTLKSVLEENKKYIDKWTILDTGSTDGTQNVIKEVMNGKKGKLYEHPFDNFRESRNRCLDLSTKSCKYTVMLDDTYVIKNDLRNFLRVVRDDIFADSFSFIIVSQDVEYSSNRLVRTDLNLRFINKIHEIFEHNVSALIPKEESFIFDIQSDFMVKRTRERKEFDLRILLEMVEEEPDNPRHLYYVAQTYSSMENYEKAVEYFRKRIDHKVNGHTFEKLDAYFELARTLNFKMGRPIEEVKDLYLKSYELDTKLADSIYFIGINYYNRGDQANSYHYFKKAFEIGYDVNSQYSLKPTISFYYVPLLLSSLCYIFNDYELGERCCLRFLSNNKNDTMDYQVMTSWYKIFIVLKNKKSGIVKREGVDKICFIADGGFEKWSGSDINRKGIGGSETYIIEMARAMKNNSNYDVYVFCNCEVEEDFEGVKYRPLMEIFDFFAVNYVKHCYVSRFLEYYPFVINSNVENVYILFHDLVQGGSIIPKSEKLKKIFCLTEWHVSHVTNFFPDFKDIIVSFNYGINQEQFLLDKKKIPYKFIYTSFPNRGLLPLLNMWPKILQRFPDAELHTYVDLNGKWVNDFHGLEMNMIKEIMKNRKNVYNHGWVSKKELAESWAEADVWFYPCKFNETFCLTALEAALSKTLAVTNGLAALDETVGDRGIKLEGDVMSNEWQDNAVMEITRILGNREEKERLIEKNYRWAIGLSWDARGRKMLEIIGENKLEYVGMYNWTNDIPRGSREIFLDVINKFNGKGIIEPKILEIGSYAGVSLIEILRKIPNSIGYALDSWKSYGENKLLENLDGLGVEESFMKNIRIAGLEERVVKVKSDSQDKLVEYLEKGMKFDFIYVDGSHKAIDAYADSYLSWKLLNVGGIMAIDDYLMSGMDILDVPLSGINHFMERMEGSYKILHKGYRIFLEKISN